jgi:hypothetical protein
MTKFTEITQDSNEGLSCPVCGQRIIPRTSSENTAEDDAFLDGYTEPNYCTHTMYAYFGADIIYLSKEIIAALIDNGYQIELEDFYSVTNEKNEAVDLSKAFKNTAITEYHLTSHLPFEENSSVGFKVD